MSVRSNIYSDFDVEEDSVDLDLEPGNEDDDDDAHAVQAPISNSKRKAPATDSETSGESVSVRDKPHKMPRLDLGVAPASSGVQDAGRGFNSSPDSPSPPLTRGIEPRLKDVDTVPIPRDPPPVPDDDNISLRRRPPPEPPVPNDDVLGPRSSLFSVDSDVDGGVSRAQPSGTRAKMGVQSLAPGRVGASRVESRVNSGTSSSSSEFSKTLSHTVQKVFARDRERERERERDRARKQELMRERRDAVGSLRRGPPVTARKQTASVKNIRVSTASLLKDAQNPNNSRNESAPWTRIKRKRKPIRTNYEEEMMRARPLDMARRRGGDMVELTDSSDSTRHPRPSATTGPRASALANKDDPIIITSGSEDGRLLAIRPTLRRKTGPSGTQGGRGVNRPRVPPPVDVEVISISDSEEEELGERGVGVAQLVASTSGVNRPSQGAPPPPPKPAIAPPPAPIPASAPTLTVTQLPEPPASIPQDTRQQDAELPPPSSSYGPSPDDFDDPFRDLDFDTTGDDALFRCWEGTWIKGQARVRFWEEVGDGVKGTAESGAANDLGVSTRDGPSTSGSGDNANVDGDVSMQSLEEGEVDPNDTAPMLSMRTPDTPESGEIRSQESRLGPASGGEVRTADWRVTDCWVCGAVSCFVFVQACPGETCADIHACACGIPLGRMRTLVMPDISSYRGVRFKRPPPEPRENPFFSRALNGAGRSAKVLVSMGERSTSGGAPTPVPVEVGEVQSRDADTNMQDDAAASVPEAAVPMPTAVTSTQARPSIVEPSTTVTDGPPVSASAQSPPPSSQAMTSLQPLPVTQPLARSSSRPFIAPSRVPRTSAPMSLVDALNEVRRERLEAFREQGELARGRNVIDPMAGEDPTASMAALPKSAAKGPVEAPPSQPSTPTPTSSRSQSTKALGRTPSLNDIRMLLARRNVSGSQPGRSAHGSTSTSTPARTSYEDGDTHVPVVPVAVPAPRSTDGNDRLVSWLEGASTPTPTTTTTTASGLGASSNGETARRREVSFVPFRAFISPAQSLDRNVKHSHNDHEKERSDDKGKGREIVHPDHASVSPTAPRSRTDGSVSLLGSQRLKAREYRHRRRESASTAFEAYIVRDSFKQTSVTCVASTAMDPATATATAIDDVRPDVEPPVQPQLPQVPRLSESGSCRTLAGVDLLLTIRMGWMLTQEMIVLMRLAWTTGWCWIEGAVGESETTGEGEDEDEADEADALLELASVHLSQEEPEVVAVDEANKVGEMEVIDERRLGKNLRGRQVARWWLMAPLRISRRVGADGEETVQQTTLVLDDAPGRPSQTEMELVRTNVVADGPPVDVAMSRGDEEETAPQTVLDDVLALPSQTEENVSMREVASEERVVQDADVIWISSDVSTPDLLLPEDLDSISSVELSSTSKDADQHVVHDQLANYVVRLATRTRWTSVMQFYQYALGVNQSSSKLRSISRAASSADLVDFRPPALVPERTICGYRILTWASHVAAERERLPEVPAR
ncbi:hypothetical protein J3R82DRAFT_9949 [Butyriboletus roseoflavus]|nr:hypothetical protein J3R82DRAFT_9949 [Butyriboletus roseoflavus]